MLTFFNPESEGSIQKPFVEEYVEKHPESIGKPFSILEVSSTRKKTGYMVNAGSFSVFLFQDSQILQMVLEALNAYITSNFGYELFVVPQEKSPYYAIAADFEKPAQWTLTKGKYYCLLDVGSGLENAVQNPFLPPNTQNGVKKRKPMQTSVSSQNPSSMG